MLEVYEDASGSSVTTPPPLSPTKSISTQGWSSPPTPGSPRKVRSCLILPDISEPFLPTEPDFSKKPTFLSRLHALRCADIPNPELEVDCLKESPAPRSRQITRSNNRSAPSTFEVVDQVTNSRYDKALSSLDVDPTTSDVVLSPSDDHRCSRESRLDNRSIRESFFIPRETPLPSDEDLVSLLPKIPAETNVEPIRMPRRPLRCSSSPLRPSQWAARGGLLSPTRSQSRTPDRFISSRRPPHVARESFELSRPADRVSGDSGPIRGNNVALDPFGQHLHRSGRINDELRSLREAHSILVGRANSIQRTTNASLRRNSFTPTIRQVSAGAVWNVGGTSAASDTVVGVSNGRGGLLGSGTNAPLYTSMFLNRPDPDAEIEAYERRLALAFDIDQTNRVLGHSTPITSPGTPTASINAGTRHRSITHVWRDNAWTKDCNATLLDAPQLRDDYYCTLLAYSHTAKCLAVGLGNFVHLWSERQGVDTPESLNTVAPSESQHITSLAFSSTQGGQAILAVGRADGRLSLWSPFDTEVRFNAEQPKPISCVSFRPTVVKRPSRRDRALTVSTEELLLGDEIGHIYFYSVEWPNEMESALFGWDGALTLLARLNFHSQQICGLSWSADGELFASGGNDNACYLFETRKMLLNRSNPSTSNLSVRNSPSGETIWTISPNNSNALSLDLSREKHKWELNAAVKAIAFCPWQRGLLAIGGGSNDRCIHFYHTISGACLATIDCAAQVTSLVWSSTRKEIAATFGFAQPEHPYRVAVFAWPSCEQIVAIPWFDENRALFAIPYPGGPASGRERGEDGVWWARGADEGCIVVAASDAAIRFHEIWTENKRGLGNGAGLLGGSEILENMHGIERAGEQVIR